MAKRILIIGGGPGGYVAAIRGAQLGADVTLVEKDRLGGTCLNVGCIPNKCLLNSAEFYDAVRNHSNELGVSIDHASLDFVQVMARKSGISAQLSAGVAGLLKMNRVHVVNGEAYFSAPGQTVIRLPDGSAEPFAADAIIVATGSSNIVPNIPGVRENPNCIDSTGALSLEALPESMIVIGAGVIGLELACAYAAFGTRITVIEAAGHILPMLDGDLTKAGIRHMKKMGIELFLECPVEAVEPSPAGAKVICKTTTGEALSFEAGKVLVAIGRCANTASLKLEAGGIQNERGRILVNDRMETNIPGVYAVGDCVFGRAQLAHTASAMGEVAVENIMGHSALYDERSNPICVYIEPEAASVGLTEEQCKEQGLEYRVGKFPMSANGKALILNSGEGLAKIISDVDGNRVLGMHIIGPRATDLISEGALAIQTGASVNDLISTIHSHPTVTESVREAALHLKKRAIHTRN